MRRTTQVALAALVGLLAMVAVTPGLARARHRGEAADGSGNTFSGSCQFTASVAFQPPLTNMPQTVEDRAAGSGTCSGTFRQHGGRIRSFDNAQVTYAASDQGTEATCAEASATGAGTLSFPWGTIRFALAETRATGVATLLLSGADGGSATGTAAPSPSDNALALAESCAGAGLTQVNVTIDLATTPSISG